MEFAHPIRTVVPSLDGPVLEILAGTSLPMTVFDVHRLSGTGSVNGVRKVLERLVAVGLVTDDRRSNAVYYQANREHIAWPAVESLARLRASLLDAMVREIGRLSFRPLHASLFGSAARRTGDEQSDVDLLLIAPGVADYDENKADEIEALSASILRMTGNPCQVFSVTMDRLREHIQAQDPLVDAWLKDGVHLVGSKLDDLVDRARPSEAR